MVTYFALICVMAGQISAYHGGHYASLEICLQAREILINHREMPITCWCSIGRE